MGFLAEGVAYLEADVRDRQLLAATGDGANYASPERSALTSSLSESRSLGK
jgi:hypothetical protein